ncbi:hypothetical protein AAON49_00120, partial [Pseudotenacibaculum sp. MALMAid0570]|uniref:hypothetical protein n=1 Tax=Pseudotenacibaculum sp. MALMAid0570 TaxID=3143938 RepID=UPI0032E0546D
LNADGTRIAIGAYLNDGNGTDAGHVRVYGESGGTWTQLGGDIDGEAAGDQSGYSVSLNDSGDYLIVGGLNNDENGNNAGHARIYNYNGTSWVQIGADINGQTASEQFGFSVSINGDGTIVAIGARRHSPAGIIQVYEFSGGTWNQLGNDIEGEIAGEWFGYSVSISADGTYLVGGARRNNSDSGKARVFKYTSVGDWAQVGSGIVGEATVDFLSFSVSISGDGSTVVIGAPLNDTNGTDAGQVKIYAFPKKPIVNTLAASSFTASTANIGGEVTNQGAFDVTERGVVYSFTNTTPTIGAADVTKDTNGSGIGIFNETIIGLNQETTYYYRAYATNSEGTSYGAVMTFTTASYPIDDLLGEANGDQFGYSVAVSADGTRMIAGARNNDNASGTDAGHARVYEFTNGVWTQLGADINGANAADFWGSSVSISDDGTRVAVGSPSIAGSTGAVGIYQYNGSAWVQVGSNISGEASGDSS